ncbi:MAG: PEP-CTERM sorting domain-containing protein [Bryobacteraceae bacterium]|nr:PEP-CTERM sorting domain-containing protein [Bryobacteraceae bacterium]
MKILGFTFIALAASCIHATPIPGLLSTGSSAPGSPDPAWTYFYSPVPVSTGFVFTPAFTTSTSDFPFPLWLANDTNSRWISPQPGYGHSTGVFGDPQGYYYFVLPFTLGSGYVASTGTFTFRVSTDNALNSIILNGTYLGTPFYGSNDFSAWTGPITAPPGTLIPGLNQLAVIVYNWPTPGNASVAWNPHSWNPAGVRVEILSSYIDYSPPSGGVIPEPATIWMAGAGLTLLGLWKSRRKRGSTL